jgi:tetratricopeptide (TPR) repeat protein
MTCTEYLQLFEKTLVQLHETNPDLRPMQKVLYAVWNISFAHIEARNANAALLLRQWMYFDCEDLWYELLQNGEYKPDWLREVTRDSLTFHATMKLLSEYGFVQANMLDRPDAMDHAESTGYSMSVLVHLWMFLHHEPGSNKEMARAAFHCVGSHAPTEEQPELWWAKQRRLLRHVERCCDAIDMLNFSNEELELLHALAAVFAGQDRFHEATSMFKWLIELLEKARGPEDKSTLTTIYNLGGLYFQQDRLDEAKAMYERALGGFEKVQELEDGSSVGSAVELRLDCLVNLGNICSRQGLLQDTRQYYLRAHEGLFQVSGASSQDVIWLSKRLEEIAL